MEKRERDGLALIAAGPRHWLTAGAMHNLKTIIGFPLEAPSLSLVGLAARASCAITVVPKWREYAQLLDNGWACDDRLLVAPLANWYSRSCAVSLREAHSLLVRQRIVRDSGAYNRNFALSLQRGCSIQTALARALREHVIKFSLDDFLRQRWKRWFDGLQLTNAIRMSAKAKCSLQGQVPACVLHAVLITWFNGWCTSRRFQGAIGPCRLCNVCEGRDEVEHYVQCPWAWKCALKFARLGAAPYSMSEALLLEPYERETCARRAVMLFALYGAFNGARASDMRLNPRTLRLTLLERFRAASQMNKRVSSLFAFTIPDRGRG